MNYNNVILYIMVGILTIFNIVRIYTKNSKKEKFYKEPDTFYFFLGLLLIMVYLTPVYLEYGAITFNNGYILLIIILLLWNVKSYLTVKNVTVYNMQQNRFEMILADVLDKHEIDFSLVKNDNSSKISLKEKRAAIRIKQGILKKDKLYLKFIRFNRINKYKNIIRDLQQNVDKEKDPF